MVWKITRGRNAHGLGIWISPDPCTRQLPLNHYSSVIYTGSLCVLLPEVEVCKNTDFQLFCKSCTKKSCGITSQNSVYCFSRELQNVQISLKKGKVLRTFSYKYTNTFSTRHKDLAHVMCWSLYMLGQNNWLWRLCASLNIQDTTYQTSPV